MAIADLAGEGCEVGRGTQALDDEEVITACGRFDEWNCGHSCSAAPRDLMSEKSEDSRSSCSKSRCSLWEASTENTMREWPAALAAWTSWMIFRRFSRMRLISRSIVSVLVPVTS